jgi:hypothetical protein
MTQAVPEIASVILFRRSEFLVIGCSASIRTRLNSAGQFAFNALELKPYPLLRISPRIHSR